VSGEGLEFRSAGLDCRGVSSIRFTEVVTVKLHAPVLSPSARKNENGHHLTCV
jgi:hypothetical protein